jgi:nicotinamide mononucleotide transporter
LYAFIFWDKRLFADAALQVVFGASSAYGIWQWSRGGIQKDLHPIKLTPLPLAVGLWLGGIAATGLLGWCLSAYTADPRPWADAALTVASLAAQYQLARKFLENWLVWIAVDVVYVFLYIDQQLYYTAFLYAAYLGIAAWGYFSWKKNLIRTIKAY